MENATKALMIAAGVLIALVIIGALLLMFNSLSDYQKTDTQNTREAQIVEFNNQYETYIRKNVRGSDLYSLLNKVIDYNRRKSSAGTGEYDEGQYIAYEPMKVEIDLNNKLEEFYASNDIQHLIQQSTYIQSDTNNQFEKIYKTIKDLENKYGQDSLNNLVVGKDKIFIDNNSSDTEKNEAIQTFNNISKKVKVSSYNDIVSKKNDVYQYYEYIQFKRAKFDCQKEEIQYSSTGRIISMKFVFNGKFN